MNVVEVFSMILDRKWICSISSLRYTRRDEGNVDLANESSVSREREMLKNKKRRNIRVEEDHRLSLPAWKHSFERREPEK